MSPITLTEDQADALAGIRLLHGSHPTAEDGMCVMEAVAWVAGEPHSDHPQCASPVISTFLRTWNDNIDADDRQTLKVFIPQLVGTASTPEVELARSWMAFDWLVRTHTVAWLRLAGLTGHADALAGLPELGAGTGEAAYLPTIQAAKGAARDAARAAAWDAARDAAWDAVGGAAWAAARAAAKGAARAAVRGAAWDAAEDAAGAAAWDAAGDAARGAARDALRPTVVELQASARQLVTRMIEAA